MEETNKLVTTFTCLGPVARTCLETIDVENGSEYNRTLRTYLGKLDREIDKFVARGGHEPIRDQVDNETSHRIAIMRPTRDGLSYSNRIATRWVAYRVYERALEKSQQDCFNLYKHLSRQQSLRSSAGWFFEGYVHDWFRLGGTFEADQIPIISDNTPPFSFKTVKSQSGNPNYFTTAEDLAQTVRVAGGHGIAPSAIEQYFIPFSRTYESVDSLVFSNHSTLLLFQITIARQHGIKGHGIKQLIKALPETIKDIYIVFVVPEECLESYSKTQHLSNIENIRPNGTEPSIKQFRLAFTEEKMQAVAVYGLSEMQEEGEDDWGSDLG